jgi:integrase
MALTDTAIRQLKSKEKNYKVSDGEGLNLLVRKSGTKSWQWKYRFIGKEKSLSIGSYPVVGLKEARRLKTEAQHLLSQNIDPSTKKQQTKQEIKKLHDGKFSTVSNDWIKNQLPRWSTKYATKTQQTLSNWVSPKLNDIPVANISSRDLLDVLRGMEAAGIGETTRKMKGVLENIFTFAIVEGHIDNNPATGLEKALKAIPRVRHQRSLAANKIGEFAYKIQNDTGHPSVNLGLMLLLYTNVRTNEIRFAQWHEIDMKNKVWTIPADKMKMKSDHKVPLSKQSIQILKQLKPITGHQTWVVKSPNLIDKPLSENAFLNLLKRIGMTQDTTVHGLRATASTFLNEKGYRSDVIERQLAHVEKDQVRKAYNHAEYWEERSEMAQFWANHVDKALNLYQGNS